MSETVLAVTFLETGGIGRSESCEEVEYSMLSTDLASPALRRLQSVISDFRPPGVTESGGGSSEETARESRHRRLFVDF